MVKHTYTIRRQQPMNCLSVFDHFVGLWLKELNHALTLNKHLEKNTVDIWVLEFKSGPSKICGRQPLKNFK